VIPAAARLSELEQAACRLIDSLPAAYQDSFKVFSGGFYLHQEHTGGGFPDAFQRLIDAAAAQSTYYLLFGKQTDKDGMYTKFWVALKLPNSFQFSCMTALQREVYKKRVEVKTSEKYAANQNAYFAYHEAEITGIEELMKIISEIKGCCVAKQNGTAERSAGCDGCSDELANFYLNDFEIYQTTTTEATNFSVLNNSKLKEVSNIKLITNSQNAYVSAILSPLVEDFNQILDFRFLITSNEAFCSDTIQAFEDFFAGGEFTCWINLSHKPGTNQSDIKMRVVWHSQNKILCKNYEQAQVMINYFNCIIKNRLQIINDSCDINFPPPNFYDPPVYFVNFPDPPPIIKRKDWGADYADLSKGYELIENENLAQYYHTIVIHHSGNATNYPTMKSVQEEQMDGGYADIAYNYGIDKDGKIYYGRPLFIKQAHVKGGHKGLIGIVMLADLDTQNSGLSGPELLAEEVLGDGDVSDEMYQSLVQLTQYLKVMYGIDYFGAHKEVHSVYNPTDVSNGDGRNCPGNLGTQLVQILRTQLGLLYPIKK
jgi:hypothetical protein